MSETWSTVSWNVWPRRLRLNLLVTFKSSISGISAPNYICARNCLTTKLINQKKGEEFSWHFIKRLRVSSYSSVLRSKGLTRKTVQPCEASVHFSASSCVSKVCNCRWEGWSSIDTQDSTFLHSVSPIRNTHSFCYIHFTYFEEFGLV